jgi:hypothetical protein
MENDSIYGGHSKKPKKSDMIIPKVLPYDAETKDMEKIEQAEEVLVDANSVRLAMSSRLQDRATAGRVRVVGGRLSLVRQDAIFAPLVRRLQERQLLVYLAFKAWSRLSQVAIRVIPAPLEISG